MTSATITERNEREQALLRATDRKAARRVLREALDGDDAVMLLDMLGLPGDPAKIRQWFAGQEVS